MHLRLLFLFCLMRFLSGGFCLLNKVFLHAVERPVLPLTLRNGLDGVGQLCLNVGIYLRGSVKQRVEEELLESLAFTYFP